MCDQPPRPFPVTPAEAKLAPMPQTADRAEEAHAEDLAVARALRAGDEAAFTALVDRHFDAMLRLATVYLPDQSVAEEVVQDAWVRVLRGIGTYEGRASLKTWIFRILINCARTRAQRESRSVPFSSLAPAEHDGDELAPDADQFLSTEAEPYGVGIGAPRAWADLPEERLLSRETRVRIEAAIAHLSERQRMVISLRDIEGWSPEEVCNFLGLSESNQRVLLHRARMTVRRALERYFGEE